MKSLLRTRTRRLAQTFKFKPQKWFVHIRDPSWFLDRISTIYTINEEPSEIGPFETVELERAWVLAFHKEKHPEKYEESLRFNREEELVSEGFGMGKQGLLLSWQGWLRHLEYEKKQRESMEVRNQ